jgi:hypothetical protein
MNRPQDWPMRLHLFLVEKRAQPFDWKTNNCAFFACDWIAILTGKDPAAAYRPQVDSALSAARAMGGLTVEQIAERVCAENGWPEVPMKLARRGDVALIDTDAGDLALGVCEVGRVAFASPHGVHFLPTKRCRRAWRID